jgi:hypothetical protein
MGLLTGLIWSGDLSLSTFNHAFDILGVVVAMGIIVDYCLLCTPVSSRREYPANSRLIEAIKFVCMTLNIQLVDIGV